MDLQKESNLKRVDMMKYLVLENGKSGVSVYLTIRPAARKGYGSITHEAKPNGLLTRGP